jgi:hypothetical protein
MDIIPFEFLLVSSLVGDSRRLALEYVVANMAMADIGSEFYRLNRARIELFKQVTNDFSPKEAAIKEMQQEGHDTLLLIKGGMIVGHIAFQARNQAWHAYSIVTHERLRRQEFIPFFEKFVSSARLANCQSIFIGHNETSKRMLRIVQHYEQLWKIEVNLTESIIALLEL